MRARVEKVDVLGWNKSYVHEYCGGIDRLFNRSYFNVAEEFMVTKYYIYKKTSEGKYGNDNLREIRDMVGSLKLGGTANTDAHDSSTSVD